MYVGLLTGASQPSARRQPRTSVVLPAPSSPEIAMSIPPRSADARRSPAASVAYASGRASVAVDIDRRYAVCSVNNVVASFCHARKPGIAFALHYAGKLADQFSAQPRWNVTV